MQGVTAPWECERVLVILYSIYAMSAWEFLERTFASPNKCFMLQWGGVWNRHAINELISAIAWLPASCLAGQPLMSQTEWTWLDMIFWRHQHNLICRHLVKYWRILCNHCMRFLCPSTVLFSSEWGFRSMEMCLYEVSYLMVQYRKWVYNRKECMARAAS